MYKYLIILIICLVCTSGCDKSWTKEEQKLFIEDCQTNNSEAELRRVCECVLECLEANYDSYNLALSNLEKFEINKNLEQCLNLCPQ